jgi:GR25 family glycosyltransferase involved in LPS biosynthesis
LGLELGPSQIECIGIETYCVLLQDLYSTSMSFPKLLVVVIQTPGSDRYIPINVSLGMDPRFNLVYLPATMLSSNHEISLSNVPFNRNYFRHFQGRDLTPQEVGCAHSHNAAREIISQSPLGGIILEDDARIVNLDLLFAHSFDFLSHHQAEASILSLTGYRNLTFACAELSASPRRILRLNGQPDLAVAYALTMKAAKKLVCSNTPIKWVSDWPLSNSNYFAITPRVVTHGDQNTKSIILNGKSDYRFGVSPKYRRKLFSIHFILKNFYPNSNFALYLKEVFLRRITWNLDLMVFHLKGIKHKDLS